MKIDNITPQELTNLITTTPENAAFVGILPNGNQRAKYVAISDLMEEPDSPRIIEARLSEIFWADKNKKRIESPFSIKSAKAKTPTKDSAKKTPKKTSWQAAKDAATAPATKPQPANTGYTAFIRSLLMEGTGKTSKYTISEAADVVLQKYPGKDIKSLKRIAYNLVRLHKRSWKKTVVGTGYLARIDELLREGKLTTRLVGECVSVEFNKDPRSAINVVRARLAVLKGMGEKVNPPYEDAESRQTTYLG